MRYRAEGSTPYIGLFGVLGPRVWVKGLGFRVCIRQTNRANLLGNLKRIEVLAGSFSGLRVSSGRASREVDLGYYPHPVTVHIRDILGSM